MTTTTRQPLEPGELIDLADLLDYLADWGWPTSPFDADELTSTLAGWARRLRTCTR